MIKIISFVDTFKHFEIPINEYQKRLGKQVDFIKLKPSKRKTEVEIVEEETSILKEKLKLEKGFKILLYIEGKNISTEDLYKFIEEKKQNYNDIIFIIGGAYGLNFEEIKNLIDYRLSFSLMTFPHSLAILILLEQIYRCIMIKKGTSYHH